MRRDKPGIVDRQVEEMSMSSEQAEGVQVRDNRALHRFEADLGEAVAVAVYTLMDGKIMFTHTEVPERFEGRGIGTALIEAGLASARERGLKVIPTCPFFASYMKRHGDTHDLLEPAYRTVLGV
jgi:predicted GNAT family acetyltransferase